MKTSTYPLDSQSLTIRIVKNLRPFVAEALKNELAKVTQKVSNQVVNQVKTEKIIAQDSDILCKIFRYLPQRMKLFLIVLYIIRKIDTPLPQAILPDIDQEDKPLREKRSTKSRKRKNPDYVRAHHMFSRILKSRILNFLFVIFFS